MSTGMDKVAANTPENPAPANSYSPGESENGMTLFEHLGELRKRLLIIVAGLAVGVIVSFAFADRLIQFMAQPIGGLANLQSIEITENVGVFMRVSLLGGFILAFPLILYEIIAFVVPGLKSSERKWVFLSIPLLFLMFVGGVAFTYLVMLPAAVPFLVSFLGVTTVPRLSNYFNFVTNLMFWVGIIFETPSCFHSRQAAHCHRRDAAQGLAVCGDHFSGGGCVDHPTVDPVNMALFMTPMLGLYLLSVLMAVFAR